MPKLNMDDATLLAAALEGLELQRARIDEQIQKVRSMLGKGGLKMAAEAAAPVKLPVPRKQRRRLSAEGRARIAEAQKKRWAAARKKSPKQGGAEE